MSENGEYGRTRARIMRSMPLDSDACYRALTAHDTRFDGRFFVGVSSTRIYCRPVCTVRMPRRENCRFFPSAAAAEVAGYRPCLRCRPELAPGHASVDASERLARGAVSLIEDGVLDAGGIEHLAERVGVTSRHLRRIFESEYGVSPIEYAQTHRLLLAKRLLTDTSLPVTEIALASGFASVRRFNALFRARYRMAPGRLRVRAEGDGLPATLVFELAYRPPYDWDAMLDFLRARAVAGVEHVSADAYARSIAVVQRGTMHAGRVEVRRARRRHALAIAVSPSLARAVPAVLSRVKHAFDLACDPAVVAAALGELASARPGLRVPGTCDGFELAVRAIVGQQISVRGARTVLGRIVAAFGEPLPEANGEVSRLFPTAARLAGGGAGSARPRRHDTRARPHDRRGRARHRRVRARPGARKRRRNDARSAHGHPRHRRLDGELHRHARAALARCFPRGRPRRPQGARRRSARAGARARRNVAAVARLRRHSPVEIHAMSSIVRYAEIATPLGRLRFTATSAGLTGIAFEGDRYAPPRSAAWIRDPAFPPLKDAAKQLADYFGGHRSRFDLPLAPTGTPFQRVIWAAIAAVPAGETISYAELARRAGRPGSARAAGAATGRNPLAIVVPCHRIVGSDGSLTGYAGGLDRKRALLEHERAFARLPSAA